MKWARRLIIVAVLAIVVVAGLSYLGGHNLAVLNPKGLIATQEQRLLIIATLLGLIVVLPVFALTAGIVWRYRASNTRATYQPDWDHNPVLEFIWWGIPCAIIAVLAVITWTSSHQLDPYRPISSNVKPLTVQVVALDWKWLFIYPEQHIATVNFLPLPVNTPINFEITSDAPMNSFWIPQLGGQMYAMPGMSSQLHLLATTPGVYRGSSANISGQGFAGMHFNAQVVGAADFATWVKAAQAAPQRLDWNRYTHLSQPSQNNPLATYQLAAPDLYDTIVMKFMMPMPQS